jgi:60 kDa SS-A/Ro ribonucleoprotein
MPQPNEKPRRRALPVDCFVILTDNETWAGRKHPKQALDAYRQATGIPAKMVTVAMASNRVTLNDPNDAGTLDVVGFDTATQQLISEFARSPIAV